MRDALIVRRIRTVASVRLAWALDGHVWHSGRSDCESDISAAIAPSAAKCVFGRRRVRKPVPESAADSFQQDGETASLEMA